MSKTGDKIIATSTKEVKGNCYFCGKEVDGMDYCFGCNHFVCEDCVPLDSNDLPMGKHKVKDHKG